MLRCILEKLYDFNLELHLLFIAFGQAYDAINRIFFFRSFKGVCDSKEISERNENDVAGFIWKNESPVPDY